jgi:secondary thiamine-phosphate synthase enzyme
MGGAVEEVRVRTTRRTELVDLTARLEEVVARGGLREGALVAQSLHTTAGLTINENADPDVARDMADKLDRLAPRDEGFYRHAEGNSDSHVKTTLVGPSLTVIVSGGRLVLGTWQGVYLCEFDGPRERRVAVRLLSAAP